MPELDWEIPPRGRPKPEDFAFDLDRTLSAVVAVHSTIPEDAFTASTLGTERAGNGVVIRENGLVLTIGYLITEAEQIWLHTALGTAVPGHVLGYDQESGFGLVQALGRLNVPALEIGRSERVRSSDQVIVAGAGGRRRALDARVIGKREFAGYWEYLLEEAIFTAPAHPNWGGTAVINGEGKLVGVGSLHVQEAREGQPARDVNMIVPIDLLPPILDELSTYGRRNKPARPWLGLYAAEAGDRLAVVGLARGGPADQADIRVGDLLVAVDGARVSGLAGLFRTVWARGNAGVEVPLTLMRDGRQHQTVIRSGDRAKYLKAPRLH